MKGSTRTADREARGVAMLSSKSSVSVKNLEQAWLNFSKMAKWRLIFHCSLGYYYEVHVSSHFLTFSLFTSSSELTLAEISWKGRLALREAPDLGIFPFIQNYEEVLNGSCFQRLADFQRATRISHCSHPLL